MYLYIIFVFEAIVSTGYSYIRCDLKYQYIINEGNSTHNAECGCLNPIDKPVNNICWLPCSPGETFVTNIGCVSCPYGTYKNFTSHDECTECTECNITIFQCTSISDTICGNTTILTSGPIISDEGFKLIIILILIPIGIFFVLIIISVSIIYLTARRGNIHPQLADPNQYEETDTFIINLSETLTTQIPETARLCNIYKELSEILPDENIYETI